jgi:glycosyltransferase involved in cell wall biosynthesis
VGCAVQGVETSIGLPVFNGEAFVATAIESILDQTYADFELIICDNASSDGTEEICREFERLDDRVRYVRNKRNIGADPNFNRTLDRAHGRYFKWAAHDDILEPTFLERCVTALKQNPTAVLCQSLVRVIDADGRPQGIYDSRLHGTASEQASKRFAAAILIPHWCTEIFGVIRSDALRATAQLRGYHHCDRVLLAELALLGKFIQVPDPLFCNRDHDRRYVRAVHGPMRSHWHDTTPGGGTRFAIWRMLSDYTAMVPRHVHETAERRHCRLALARWLFVNWNALRLIAEPVSEIDPRLGPLLGKIKRRTVGAAPSGFRAERTAGDSPR